MPSAAKHLGRLVRGLVNEVTEMLRCAQHDNCLLVFIDLYVGF